MEYEIHTGIHRGYGINTRIHIRSTGIHIPYTNMEYELDFSQHRI